MKENKSPFCKNPFLIGFTKNSNDRVGYRDCCAKRPLILSDPGQKFRQWWKSDKLNEFREKLMNAKEHPPECSACKIAEQDPANNFSSYRTSTNKWETTDYSHPAGWNIQFGNTCNLACWICNEASSSTIHRHKKRAGLLSGQDTVDSNFEKIWPDLRENILKSYEHHETVNLTILGGEPLYNKIVIGLLDELIQKGLANRTILEFHTNGTVFPDKIFLEGNKSPWKYVSTFLSLDAAGPYAEWLRYGCKWDKVDKVVDSLKVISDFCEIHCTITVLNINQLYEIESYAKSKKCRISFFTSHDPVFLSLGGWDLPKDQLLVNQKHKQYEMYYDLIGKNPLEGSSEQIKKYIRKFDGIRRPLREFDQTFAEKLGW
tara:strand:+ start:4742 stop:5863 length:1122 start_codon:yes stop_codon:yes gene_type:complete